jgi:hypothetical protein
LTTKILTYVKDKEFNLQTCANALTSIVSCDYLILLKPFDGSCLRLHTLSKVCQYATIDEKLGVDLSSASIKVVQSII